jgi:ATP-dependent exoDNAse (exonuclease V) alpha subunit
MKLLTILGATALLLSTTSCGWKATDQEIKTMEDQRSAALKAEETLQNKERELKTLTQDVEQAKAKKAAAEAELEKVKKALAERGN